MKTPFYSHLILALVALASCLNASAADLTADELQTPTSPAFALVGVSPTKIDRPGSAPAFGASLLNAATESSGGVPKNLAFEFAPYWWMDHPALSREEFDKANLGNVVMQSATLSIASYEKEATATIAAYSGIGAGLRFDFVRGKANPALVKKLQDRLNALVAQGGFEGNLTPEQEKELQKMASSYDASRVGHQLSFATAIAYRFDGNDLDKKTWDRYGAWLTYAFKPVDDQSLAGQLTFLATVRTLKEHAAPSNLSYTDFGGKLLWRDPTHPVAISVEYVKRTGDAHDEAINGLLQYKAADSWFIFISHGKQLAGDSKGDKKLTVAGISLSWGKTSKLKI